MPYPIVLTRAPVYTSADAPMFSPAVLDPHDHGRIGAAISAAKRLHPGAVGQCLVGELEFYRECGHRVDHASLAARLVDELLRPPR